MNDTTRPTSVRVIADHCDGPHRTDSDDIWWWLPVLGPTATVLAYLLARHAAYNETCWDTTVLARSVGLAGNRCKLWASLERLSQFHVVTFVATDVVTIRLNLPTLTERQLACLPECLAIAYQPTA